MKALSEDQVRQITTTGGWAIAICVGLWALYQYVLVGLYLGPRDQLDKDIIKAQRQVKEAADTILIGTRDGQVWKKLYIQDRVANSSAVELTAGAVWDVFMRTAQSAGITFQTLVNSGAKPSSGNADFDEIRFTASAKTTTARLAGFLYAVEINAEVPARIDQLNIHAITAGEDNLNVDMTIAALVYAPKKGTLVSQSTTKPVATQSSTQSGTRSTTRPVTTRTSTRPTATAAATPVLDANAAAAAEAALIAKRKAEEDAIKKAQEEQEAFSKLSPEEQEKAVEKKRQEDAAAASQKAADAAKAAAEREAEMIRRREQELGAATTTAPAGGVR